MFPPCLARLDNDSRHFLTPEVVERVRKAADEMGYRRNRMASSLRTKKTMTIGLVDPRYNEHTFPRRSYAAWSEVT